MRVWRNEEEMSQKEYPTNSLTSTSDIQSVAELAIPGGGIISAIIDQILNTSGKSSVEAIA